MKNLNELNISIPYKHFLNIFLMSIREDKRIEHIFMFGSCARGSQHSGSDIDIAIITKESLSKEEELSFYDYLLDIDPKDYISCDLLIMSREQFDEYKNVTGYVQTHIFREGVDLYEPIRTSM